MVRRQGCGLGAALGPRPPAPRRRERPRVRPRLIASPVPLHYRTVTTVTLPWTSPRATTGPSASGSSRISSCCSTSPTFCGFPSRTSSRRIGVARASGSLSCASGGMRRCATSTTSTPRRSAAAPAATAFAATRRRTARPTPRFPRLLPPTSALARWHEPPRPPQAHAQGLIPRCRPRRSISCEGAACAARRGLGRGPSRERQRWSFPGPSVSKA